MSNEATIWKYLVANGLTEAGAAGLMGNLQAESGLNPKNLQNTFEKKLGYTDEAYTAAVDSGKYTNFVKDSAGYGLAQWTYWSRKQALLQFAKAKGRSIGDIQMQLDFLVGELKGYPAVDRVLRSAGSIREASDAVLLQFERPKDQSEAVRKKRAAFGQEIYDRQRKEAHTMSVTIGHASIDERGRARGGAAGDQTGREVCTRAWYNKPWTVVLRPKNAAVAEKMAKAMEAACANNNIGYDQSQRTTLFAQAQANGWNIAAIKTKCETDCSALIAVCVNAAGVTVSKDIYTGNEKQALINTGQFTAYTGRDYIASDAKLKRGDVLLGSGHTAMVLSNGKASADADPQKGGLNKSEKWKGKVTASALNVRSWAGTDKGCKVLRTLKNGTVVSVCDTTKAGDGADWYYIKHDGKYGFVSAKYIAKV